MKNLEAFKICVVVAVALAVPGQRAQVAKSSGDERLERQVPGGGVEYLTTATAFNYGLGGVGMPGGMATIRNCEEDSPRQVWSPMGQTLRRMLDTLVETDPRYRWQLVDGVINLLPAQGEPALLKARIGKFRVRDVSSALDALNRLLALPEVKKEMEDLHLKPGIALINYWSSPNPKPFSVKCKSVTLREALNAIARAQGRDIWDYVETHCDGRNEVVIRF